MAVRNYFPITVTAGVVAADKNMHKYNITEYDTFHNTDASHQSIGEVSFMFLTYQLSMVGYWPSMTVTGPIESVFESGEGA